MRIKNPTASEGEYTRSYSNLRGVRLGSNGGSGTNRLAYSENVYRDYKADSSGAIESFPGFRKLYSFGKRINGIYKQNCYNGEDRILVHAANSLYGFPIREKNGTPKPQRLCALRDDRSHGISFGGKMYILDGDTLTQVDEDGSCITPVGGEECYVPTLYINGESYEQRNLLTDRFKEEVFIGNSDEYTHGTAALHYLITDTEKLYCSVVGIEENYEGEVYIPSTVRIGAKSYTVTEIGTKAFYNNTRITAVKMNEGLKKIGKFAFWYATSLETIITPNSAEEIGFGAFADCASLTMLYLGSGLRRLGTSVIPACINLERINYALDEESLTAVENYSVLSSKEMIYGSVKPNTVIEIMLRSPIQSIERVTVDGKDAPFAMNDKDDGIMLNLAAHSDINGSTVKIFGTLTPLTGCFDAGRGTGKKVSSHDAVCKCRVAEIFDGRIFLSGNPDLPGTVFYSSTDKTGVAIPFYFGEHNYFVDGVGSDSVVSMLAVRDSLAVFKEQDDGAGSIYYHYPSQTTEQTVPKIYPVSSVHSGIGAVGESVSFMDDPVFISAMGLCALEKQRLNYDRSVACRSGNVNAELLKENLADAQLIPYADYLAIAINGSMYLADSRAIFTNELGIAEYEWFVLRGIGTYVEDIPLYRYSSTVQIQGLQVRRGYADKPVENKEILTLTDEDGEPYYFVNEDGIRYAVEPTGEFVGGNFVAADRFYGDGELIFFGNAQGDLCIFNTDKRGVPPNRFTEEEKAEYKKTMALRIHPEFYDFNGHSVRYAIKSCLDDCGIPHLTKNTVKHSLVVKCKCFASTELHCEVYTDSSGYYELVTLKGGRLDFSELSFDSLALSTDEHCTIPIAEKERDWIEKQISLYSEGFRRPIGIYSLTYRYTVKGRIKRK